MGLPAYAFWQALRIKTMNYRIIFHTTGKVLLVEAGLLALPLLVSVLYHERCAWAVLASMAAAAVIGGLLTLLARPRRHTFFNREGYIPPD